MKFVTVVAIIAFVAVQLSHSAPTPEEEVKAAVQSADPVAAVDSTAHPLTEGKSAAPEASVSPSGDAEKESPAEVPKS